MHVCPVRALKRWNKVIDAYWGIMKDITVTKAALARAGLRKEQITKLFLRLPDAGRT